MSIPRGADADGRLTAVRAEIVGDTRRAAQKHEGGAFVEEPWGVAVVDDLAYVAGWSTGLEIVDVSDPQAPTVIGIAAPIHYAVDVAVSGDYAYVADHFEGLIIVRVTDPASPEIVSQLPMKGWGRPSC